MWFAKKKEAIQSVVKEETIEDRRRFAGRYSDKQQRSLDPFFKKTLHDFIPPESLKNRAEDSRGGSMAPSEPWDQMGSNIPLSAGLLRWFASYSFIGPQLCSLLAQHWLINNACTIPAEDAVRHGWFIKQAHEDEISDTQMQAVLKADKKYQIKKQLKDFAVYCNIFGIRIAVFKVYSDDPRYYEKPFNIDGVTKGSYQGIKQIDPVWCMPQITAEGFSDPTNLHFYEPEFWVIGTQRIHRSHLIIIKGAEVPDLLKPSYNFGGIPLTQRIYERVYAAERTANEIPILAETKRLMIYKTDMVSAIMNQSEIEQKLAFASQFRDNNSVQLADVNDQVEQLETSLGDLDGIISNQYQLVAAVAKVPATKLLGTSPKGFNATGEYEMLNYHEELESIQNRWLEPLLERHYQILMKSLGFELTVQIVWEPVDSITAVANANLNNLKANTDVALINAGVISPNEARNRLKDDKHSGYMRLGDEDVEEAAGMSPENVSDLITGASQIQRANNGATYQ